MSKPGRGERDWLRRYRAADFPPFALTVDLAIFTLRDAALQCLLIRRGEHPYLDSWALPGGHVRHGRESADLAAARELTEETGLDPAAIGVHLEQLATYSAPDRDPRIAAGLQVATVGYLALAPELPEPTAGTDASEARWWPVEQALRLELAFDHSRILSDALDRARAKLEYTTLALRFVSEPFSLAELRAVYLAVCGHAPDPANFRRKVLSTPGFVIAETGTARVPGRSGGRPAELYRGGPATSINPPFVLGSANHPAGAPPGSGGRRLPN